MRKFSCQLILTLLIVLLVNSNTFSQYKEKEAEALQEEFWLKDIPEFNTTDVPEKWKNESAVILAKTSYYLYRRKPFLVDKMSLERKRIKLLDIAAVNEFSELSIPLEGGIYTSQTGYINIPSTRYEVNIIKPDGTVRKINVEKHGVETDTHIKIAVPDLEPGDIIDYYYASQFRRPAPYGYQFGEVVYALAGKYPIVHQELKIHVASRAYLNVQALHGAPQLTKRELEEDEIEYAIIDKERESLDPQRWFHVTRNFPCVRFQAIIAVKRLGDGAFMGEEGEAKTSISKTEILELLNVELANYSDRPTIKKSPELGYLHNQIISHINKKNFQETNVKAIIKEAYYFLRYMLYRRALTLKEGQFLNSMVSLCNKYNIPFEFVGTCRRDITTIDNVIYPSDVHEVALIKTSLPVVLNTLGTFLPFDYSHPDYEGQQAYSIDPNIKSSERQIKELTIPGSPPENNQVSTQMEVSLMENSAALNINRSCIISGAQKSNYQFHLVKLSDYAREDINRLFDGKELEEQNQWFRENVQFTMAADKRLKEKALKKMTEEDLAGVIDKIEDFELLQTGRWDDQPELKFKDKFEIEGLVEKVGPNYLLHLGKLIGNQIKLEEKERNRVSDIMLPFSQAYDLTITFNIPTGYNVQGMENFNYQINNSTGSFETSASINGNKVDIKCYKSYKHNFEKAEDWPKMMEFLDAAYEFTQQKILLEKK